ncbi:MAG TPA: bifunctional DNA primase/polymerase [Vicinamibacterales bacterium]|nr:bifunctional DNA primase/polymerase [Vicinamibacterales bacterium]
MNKVLGDGTVLQGCRADLLNIGDLWARGWSLIPLKYRDKRPALASWTEFQQRPATYAELEQWFDRPEPLNVGIVTGTVSGIFVIDLDSPDAVIWARGNLPPCDMRVRTAKGLHLYYPYSGDVPVRNKARVVYNGKPLELDVRADGGYVVAPGSVHPSGAVYEREGSGW